MNYWKIAKAAGLATAITVMGATAVAAQEQPGDGVSVKSARPSWDTGWFTTEIYNELLRELGYEVSDPVTLDNPAFYQSVAQGDIDYWVEGWFPLHNTYKDTFENGAEISGMVVEAGALQGYLVDKKTADEYDITSLEDFKKDEIKELFDANGDGKADMVACPPGWGCEEVIEHHMDAYDLRDHVNLVKASYNASMADAISRYNSDEPIFFFTWTPNWTVGVLEPGVDVVWLEVSHADLPDNQKELEDATELAGVKGCVDDPCQMGWPANDIRPVANSEFLNENPAVRTLLEEASIPIDDIFAQNAKMNDGEDNEDDIKRHAQEWIETNRDTVDGWLEEARAAAN